MEPLPSTTAGLITVRGLWQQAYREFLRGRTLALALSGVGLFVVAMTIFGPLGTAESFGPLLRLLYWATCAGVAFPGCYAIAALVFYLTRFRSLLETIAALVVGVLFEGLLCTAVVHTADTLCRPAHADPTSLAAIYPTCTIVVTVVAFFVYYIIFQRVAQAARLAQHPATTANPDVAAADPPALNSSAPERDAPTQVPPPVVPPPPTAPPRFLDRLPRHLGHDVVFLKVDDHYVEVHTSKGQTIMHMRFSDAVAQLGDYGVQVHRSYWVARHHVKEQVRQDNRVYVRLTDGRLVPVSRPYIRLVRAVSDSGQG